ncbi:MAG: hypothetical protein C0608_04915 [Deltaproteobacteria bacterium]|nr:MAG: hypothetical protein C0608_04915 [Deltaproteobacteria bacterium]
MSVLGSIIMGIARILNFALTLYMWAVIASALFSWIRPDPSSPPVRFIYSITDPAIYWIRRKIPIAFGGIDFSPMILIFAIYLVQNFVIGALVDIAYKI